MTAHFPARISKDTPTVCDRVEGFVNLRRHFILAALFLFYLGPTAYSASVKPMWVDEIYTYYVSRLPSLQAIWPALAGIGDNHPPLDYWVRHLAMRLFGAGEFAFRLPSVLAFWLAICCVYWFVAKRTSPLYGFIAMLVPLSTVAHEAAFEGRYYPTVLACCGVALLSWQSATGGRRLALVSLAVSLAAALFADFNAGLVFVPLVTGEAARTIVRRRVDFGVWCAMAVGGLALVALYPIVMAVWQFSHAFWTKTGFAQAAMIFATVFDRTTPVIAGLLVCMALLPVRGVSPSTTSPLVPVHEVVAAAAFLLLPFANYLLAQFTGALAWRYTLFMVLGAGALVGFAAYRVLRLQSLTSAALLILLFVNSMIYSAGLARKQRAVRAEIESIHLASVLPEEPIPVVMGYSDLSLQALFYAKPEVASRFWYLIDREAAIRSVHSDTSELGLTGLRQTSPFNIAQYRDFIRLHRHFVLIQPARPASGRDQPWLVESLLRDRARLTPQGIYYGETMYDVMLPPA